MKRSRRIQSLSFGSFAVALLFCAAHAQAPSTDLSQATSARTKDMSWWPTKGTAARVEYAGAESCTKCHVGIAGTQRMTPMFNAASRPSESELLRKHTAMPFSDSEYSYVLSRGPDESRFLVKNDTQTISAPIGWAFGSGEVAQTYVLRRDHVYLESRLTYYTSLLALGITTGHSATAPETIEEAVGSSLNPEIVTLCFGCHTTGSTTSGIFDPDHATLGLTCEACHGPGAKHVVAMNNDQLSHKERTIFSAKGLSPVESVDFCGACHRTPLDVAELPAVNMGITNIRFQPYRLERSLCWGEKGDARITCVACHDPHKPLVRDIASYDEKCLKCHANSGSVPSATQIAGCPVGKSACASCHMPKYEIPAVHAKFTDHYIRIVRSDSGSQP